MTLHAPRTSVQMPVTEGSQVGAVRRAAANLAADLLFGDTAAGRLAVIVTEAANNLVRHARNGWIILQSLRCGDADWIEVVAADQGPGMEDVQKCLQDGYSTAGTAGQGLGAIARLADSFDVYSWPGKGTVLVGRVCAKDTACPPAERATLGLGIGVQVGAVSIPQGREHVCGDGWALAHDGQRCTLLMADGLGHGIAAAEAAGEAKRIFWTVHQAPLNELMGAIHDALRKTRGAAVAVMRLDLSRRSMQFAGVGNIAATVWAAGASRSMASHSGIVGHEMRRVQQFDYPLPVDWVLVTSSDGLTSQQNLSVYPGLAMRHPALIAGVMYRDFSRGRDDATVLVVKEATG